MSYVPLHVHSCYSFLESTLRIEQIVDFARAHELPAIALTDRDGLYGAIPFYRLARQSNIRPLLGAEIALEDGSHLLLLAADNTGYANLCRLLSAKRFMALAAQEEPGAIARHEPRFRREQLAEHAAGLICLSGCRQGALARALLHRDESAAMDRAKALAALFPGRFYVELFFHRRSDLPLQQRLCGLARALALPVVATPDAHYLAPRDRPLYQVLASIRTLTTLREPDPGKHLAGWMDLPAPEVMARRFAGVPEALANTHRIAAACDVQLQLDQPIFPAFRFLDGRSPGAMLQELALCGLHRRYPAARTAAILQRLRHELAVINQLGYAEYFLIVWDIVREARRRGICTTGRGSAADSLVCYLLGITDVCPIRHRLTFERFLNPQRIKTSGMVDIDLDIQWDRRDELIDYVYASYGHDNVAIIGSFSTYNARSAFADVGKVFGLPEQEVRYHSKQLPHTSAALIRSAGQQMVECQAIPLDRAPFDQIVAFAEQIDQLPHHLGMHPCGVVIGRSGIHHMVPLERSAKGCVVTQYDMHAVEQLGLVKMDLLGLAGLSVIPDTVRLARQSRPGLRLSVDDLDRLPPGDARAWNLIRRGDARGCFQIESPAMCSLLKMLDCHDFEALVAAVSVIRPGAANEGKKLQFARRYQGMEPVLYPHPALRDALSDTYGLMVYEEHVLTVAHQFAGMDLGRADLLRRAMVKHRTRDAFLGFAEEFERAAAARRRAPEEIALVWKLLYEFCGYAFNKAHSASYARLAYQCAWLRSRFPAEFYAAVLSSRRGFYSPLAYVVDARNHGIELLPPDVNGSQTAFTIEAGRIRVPLSQIAELGQVSVERILAERRRAGEFAHLLDFLNRVQLPREELLLLARAGALDALGPSRSRILCAIETYLWQRRQQRGAELFSMCELEQFQHQIRHVRPWTPRQVLAAEVELLGFPVSAHPLDFFAPELEWQRYVPIRDIDLFHGKIITICGLQLADRHATTLQGSRAGQVMKFITLGDKTALAETVLFPSVYRRYGRLTARSPVLALTGRVEPFDNRRGSVLNVTRAVAFPVREEGAN